MKELITGILDFRTRLRPKVLEMFQQMAKGQKPDCLFMACSDSRVVPNLFASTNPGNLFVVRNVGNLIPKPHSWTNHTTADESEIAAIEFGILQLGIKHIVVCGHSECGAMAGLLSKEDGTHVCDSNCMHSRMPHLNSWLRHGYESLEKYRQLVANNEVPTFYKGSKNREIKMTNINRNLKPHNLLSQINVIQQLDNISQYNVVKERLKNNSIELHGWWFDIANADVYSFSQKKGEYVLIDDAKAEELLDRFQEEEPEKPAEHKADDRAWPYWVPNK